MTAPADDIGGLVTRATRLWTGNFGNLLVLSLVFALVAWIPVANIGFLAGYTRAVLKVARGGKAEPGTSSGPGTASATSSSTSCSWSWPCSP